MQNGKVERKKVALEAWARSVDEALIRRRKCRGKVSAEEAESCGAQVRLVVGKGKADQAQHVEIRRGRCD